MARESRRISILVPDLRLGGLERLMTVLANEWVALGWQVDVVMLQREGVLIDSLPESCRIINLHVTKLRKAASPFAAYLRENRPHVTILAMWPLTVIGTWAWLRAGRPGCVGVSEHANLKELPEYAQFLKKWLMKFSIGIFHRIATRRIAVSEGVADSMAAVGLLSRRTIDVIYNPAAYRYAEGFELRPNPLPTCAATSAKRILAVGTLKAQKDYPTLLAAFSQLAADNDVQLTILGDGPMRSSVEDLIAKLSLQERVHLIGGVPDPTSWFRSADLFVLSSRFEGFGNVIVEALQWGIPVVSTDCPSGPREILENGRYGKLVPVGNAEALAEAMAASLLETPDRALLEARARDFSPRPIALQYLSVMLPPSMFAATPTT